MTIGFTNVPANNRVPSTLIEFNATRAHAGDVVQPFKALAIGQRRVTSQVRATGTLVLGGQPTDGDKFVVSDGTTAVTLEFDNNSIVGAGAVAVTIGGSVATTLANLLAAVNAAAFGVTALSVTGGTTVNLRATTPGTAANVAITQPVNVSTFLSSTGMSGGVYNVVGTGTSKVPYLLTSAQQAKDLFGQGSLMHCMAIAWFAQSTFTEFWAVALDDDIASTKATGTFALAGPATAAGTAYFYVGGRRFAVAVASGDSATIIGGNLATAINSDRTCPGTAVNASGTVTVTAINGGALENGIDLRHSHNQGEALPAGVTCVVTAMSGGATNPDVTLAFTAVGDNWFNVVACPYTDTTNIAAMQTEAEARWQPPRQIEAYIFAGVDGSVTACTTIAAQVNSGHMSLIPTNKSPSSSWETATAAAAQVAQSANVDPVIPFDGVILVGILPPKVQDRFTLLERNTLLFNGVAATRVDPGGNYVLNRVASTYRLNAAGAADDAFLDCNTHFTNGVLRYQSVNLFVTKYPRAKLVTSAARIAAGQQVLSVDIARGELVGLAALWESLGWIEDLDSFKKGIIVERNALSPNRLDFQISPNLANPLVNIAGQVAFQL